MKKLLVAAASLGVIVALLAVVLCCVGPPSSVREGSALTPIMRNDAHTVADTRSADSQMGSPGARDYPAAVEDVTVRSISRTVGTACACETRSSLGWAPVDVLTAGSIEPPVAEESIRNEWEVNLDGRSTVDCDYGRHRGKPQAVDKRLRREGADGHAGLTPGDWFPNVGV